jgi:hypothetical protein
MRRESSIDLIKWVALALMVFDHCGHVWIADYTQTLWRALGLAAFPLFALAFSATSKAGHYSARKLRPLILWAVLAQVPYTLLFGWRFNILWSFVLALCPLRFALPGAFIVGPFMDWGPSGVLLLIFARIAPNPLARILTPEPAKSSWLQASKHLCADLCRSIGGKIPRATVFPALYAGHLAAIVWLIALN